jgi:aldehyde:ferredoxin oxidoreductase
MSLAVIMFWLSTCAQAVILNDETTGMPVSKIGSLEFIESLLKKISFRDGFGDVLSQGVVKAASSIGPESLDQLVPIVSKAGQPNNYDPRMYINTALLHATEPKPSNSQLQEITRIVYKWLEWRRKKPHSYLSQEVARRIARIFWGSETAADFSVVDGKALAAKLIQDRQYAKECLILCGFIWPIMDSEHTEDNVGDPDLEAKILSAVMGKKVTREKLNTIGERVFNLQRAIYIRDGHRGTKDDEIPDSWYTIPIQWDMPNPEMLVPAKGEEAVSVKNAVVDKEKFKRMKQEYYQLRQWDVDSGLQTRGCLDSLGLADIAEDLAQRGLVL